MTATITRTPMTASDRCDRCGAQAHVRVFLESGTALQFCGHHFREHEVRLRSVAVDVQDELSKLNKA
jgi:Zn ribbon nucleic-acid-binding protein